MTNKSDYERVEITFRKDDPEEMAVYYHILYRSEKLGKAKYLKNLVRKDMKNKASE